MNQGFLVSVLVVVRNGRRDILGLLDSIQQQNYSPLEVLVVDGMSDDGTRALVGDYALKQQGLPIRLLDNPGRIQASGWNIGIRAASGLHILRVDAVHCRLQSADYIRRCLEKLLELQQSDPSVAATGGRRMSMARSRNAWSEAIALAQTCRFGVGNAGYRLGGPPGFKDTLAMPLYDRRALLQVGPFDESLGRSEDNDLHARLRWQGFKLYFIPDVVSVYHPRATPSGLVSQMFHNGWWVSATIVRTGRFPFGVRHLIPFAFYVTLILLMALSLDNFLLPKILLCGLGSIYLFCSLLVAFQALPSGKCWRLAIVFWIMHACYAAGTAAGIGAGRNGRAEPGVVTAPGANRGS